MGRCLAYLTVSGTDCAGGKAELAVQMAACRSYAEREQSFLFGVYKDEGGTGVCSLEKRPALLDAIGRLGCGDLLLVPGRDVLGGDPVAAAVVEGEIMKRGARVVSVLVEENPAEASSDGLNCRIAAALSDYEQLMAETDKQTFQQSTRRRRGLIEIRKRMWQSSWTLLAETMKRPDDEGRGPCEGSGGD